MTSRRDASGCSAESPASGVFRTTHWTQVLAARGESPEAKDALRELCAAYYAPVRAFIRQWRHNADGTRDLTHEFFARLLAGRSLDHLDRSRGRFRSYLLGAGEAATPKVARCTKLKCELSKEFSSARTGLVFQVS